MKKPKKKEAELRAVGVTCGIGSMLVGARAAGFKVVGNVEWRKYYRVRDDQGRNTFEENFGEKIVENLDHMSTDEIERLMGCDIALGHPECGKFSLLDGANQKVAREKGKPNRSLDPADIPLFVDLISKLKPRYFVMDDLPKSFQAFPMAEYARRLPDYDLLPEWVSNFGYGNVQRMRNRMFMLGALKRERWVFRPGEVEHSRTVADEIGDLVRVSARGNTPNHDVHDLVSDCFRALNLGGYRKKNTWGDVKKHMQEQREGTTLAYVREDGSVVNRIGFVKGRWDGPANVLTGGNACLHAKRCTPYTIRERARIQGFPDDFIFYGTTMRDDGTWSHDDNLHMIRQTGKAMPIQFCEYVSRQIAAHIRGEEFASSGERLLAPDPYVSEAKRWYCQNVGYSNQKAACGQCWMYNRCTIRSEKYNIGKSVGDVDARGSLSGDDTVRVHPRVARGDKAPRDKEEHRRADSGSARRCKEPRGILASKRAKRFGDAPKPVDVDFGEG